MYDPEWENPQEVLDTFSDDDDDDILSEAKARGLVENLND